MLNSIIIYYKWKLLFQFTYLINYLINLKKGLTDTVKNGNIFHVNSKRFYSKSKFPKKEVKMLSIVKSMSLQGLEGFLVDVQVDVSAGMPNWEVVGLPDASVRESKERVRTAIKNSEYDFPSRRIVVNLAPANTKKEGSFFDLPIAVGLLMDFENVKWQNLEDTVFIGELSLNGSINKVNGILPMCIEARKLGIKRIILSTENAKEAAIVEGLNVIGAQNLREVVEYLNGNKDIKTTKSNIKEIINERPKYLSDFSEVKGQENVKRAIEIAAARGT